MNYRATSKLKDVAADLLHLIIGILFGGLLMELGYQVSDALVMMIVRQCFALPCGQSLQLVLSLLLAIPFGIVAFLITKNVRDHLAQRLLQNASEYPSLLSNLSKGDTKDVIPLKLTGHNRHLPLVAQDNLGIATNHMSASLNMPSPKVNIPEQIHLDVKKTVKNVLAMFLIYESGAVLAHLYATKTR